MTMSTRTTAMAVAVLYIHLLVLDEEVDGSSSCSSLVSLKRSFGTEVTFNEGKLLSMVVAALEALSDGIDISLDELLNDEAVNNGFEVVNT